MSLRCILPIVVAVVVTGGSAIPTTPHIVPGPTTPAAAPAVDLTQASATIDRLVAEDLMRRGMAPPPPLDDAGFLRRAFLTVIGRIPTYEETQEFLDDRAGGRRERLIDRLQASPGRIHHDLAMWADLLRVTMRLGDRYPGQAYYDWLRTAVTANRPWDRMVTDLVTAQGKALAEDGGATGFYLRDAGMPLDHLATTVQAFLGMRIGCAQCHDHPFDTWTRKQYFALAAYTHGTRIIRDPPAGLRRMAAKEAPAVRQTLRALQNSVFLELGAPKKAAIALPADYQYADAKPGTAVEPGPLWGTAPVAGTDPRAAFATWMTVDNPRFTTHIANRMWKRVFGQGLIEPVDNLSDQSAAENPALLAHAEAVMRTVGYDLMRYQRVLLLSETFARQAIPGGAAWRGQAPVQRRLSAEQWWDSLLTPAVKDLDLRQGPRAEGLFRFYEEHRQDSAEELLDLAKQLTGLRSQADALRARADALSERLRTSTDEGEQKRLRRERNDLATERDLLLRRAEPARMLSKRAGTDGKDHLLRAAELPQPSPPDHPLRILGQSDRELIDNGSTEATIPQALWMMNGVVDQELVKGKGLLASLLRSRSDDETRITALWWAILTRPPTDDERRAARQLLADARTTEVGRDELATGWKDLVWVLINRLEFRMMP